MNDDVRRVTLPGLSPPSSPYAHAAIDGDYAFLSGVVASDLPGGAAAHGDISRETEIVMAAIRDGLVHLGLAMERIVRVDVHITDIARMPELDQVYAGFFADGALPARTCTQSGGLSGGSNVEITVMARL